MKYYVKIGVVYIKNVYINGNGHGEVKFATRKHPTFGFDNCENAVLLIDKLKSIGFTEVALSYE